MTIHGAKGLDFEHVYLMQCHKGSAPGRDPSLRYGQIDGRFEYQVLGATATPDWDRVGLERDTVEEAERVRTLYVALTRARRRLVVAGLWPALRARGGGGASMVGLLQQRLGGAPDPAAAMRDAAASETSHVDAAGARWVFPALHASGSDDAPNDEARNTVTLPDAKEVTKASAALRDARERMRAHMARALTGAASGDGHDDPEPEAERRFGEGPISVPPGSDPTEGELARAVGTALHRVLEHFDFAGDPRAELERGRRELDAWLGAALSAERVEPARTRAGAVLDRFGDGPLLARLRELDDHIVARELPVLVSPEGDSGPIAAISGAIDLVYRDPDSGELVIADYKTGQPRDYRVQGAHYQRALRGALRLDYEPRFELWYLEAGQIETT